MTVSQNSDCAVLVTGGEGFLGRRVVAALSARGRRVISLDAGWFATAAPAAEPNVEWRRGDARDLGAADLAGVEAVVHLAALSTNALVDGFPELARAVNRDGTRRLAQAARQAGVGRFVFPSSVAVYEGSPRAACDEDSPVAPASRYARIKQQTEEFLLGCADAAFSPRVLRLPTLYGDSPSLRLDLVLNKFTFRAAHGQPLEVHGDGRQQRPMLHVDDAARFVAEAALSPAADWAGKDVVNVCADGENYSARDIAALVAEHIPGARIVVGAAPPAPIQSYRVTSRRMARVFANPAPRWTPADAVEQLRRRFAAAPAQDVQWRAAVRDAWLAARIAHGALDALARPRRPDPD